MKRLQAYKFRLKTNGQHDREMKSIAGAQRFVFNKALALSNRYYRRFKQSAGYVNLANQLPKWKKLHPFLKQIPSQTLQQSLKDLDRAFTNFFKSNADFPRFKKKGISTSFRYPQGVKLEQNNNRIYLPKVGYLRYINSRLVEGLVKNVTISKKNEFWHISIQTEREVQEQLHPSTSAIGIDVGINRFAALDDESYFKPVNALKNNLVKLAKYQRAVSRKVKFSKNWMKAQRKVSKLHTSIANVRQDFLHQTSNEISKNHALIFIEDLKVVNMSKSAKGDSEHPGRMVKQKSGLNRSILDQSWGEFRRQLEYKSNWLGGEVIAVNPRNTSRTCPSCYHISKDNRKTQALFLCIACGYTHNADVVGAINIKRAGHAQMACVVNGALMPSATGTRRSELSLTT